MASVVSSTIVSYPRLARTDEPHLLHVLLNRT